MKQPIKMICWAAALLAMAALTSCKRSETQHLRAERASRGYQSAMDDIRAGRLDAAITGLTKTLRDDPGNGSVRFQLACLLQDHKKDYALAYVNYCEFLSQEPTSDRAKIAKSRLSLCERELAKTLAAKFGLDSAVTFAKETEKLTGEVKVAKDRAVKLDGDLSAAMRRIAQLRKENERLIAAIKGSEAGAGEAAPKMDVKSAKALLDEDESEDRVTQSEDLSALRQEGADELASSSLLPQQTSDAKARRAAKEAADRAAREQAEAAARKEPLHEKRPSVYVVQEGDTLTRIAIRFYGRPSAWSLIRNANKAVISTDGRVQAGMKIRLPDPR